ncbi:MAG TPA: protein-export chaperone SecB [Tenuifilaceae bacterium]|nr:protein-export chaperone SecB [Tenuifilaceae bacterium]
MRAKQSPLKLAVFHLVKNSFEFIVPKEDEIIPQVLFESYPIDIDFAHQQLPDSTTHIQVFVEIKINNSKKKSGYSIVVEGMGVFQLDDKNLENEVAYNLRIFSSLNMMINNLRNIIAQQTAFAPMGVYLMPPIDIKDLIGKKMEKGSKAE